MMNDTERGRRKGYPTLNEMIAWLGDVYVCTSPSRCRMRWPQSTHDAGRVDSFGIIHYSQPDRRWYVRTRFWELCVLLAQAKEPRARPDHERPWIAAWWQHYLGAGFARWNPYRRISVTSSKVLRRYLKPKMRAAYNQMRSEAPLFRTAANEAMAKNHTPTQRVHIWHWLTRRHFCYPLRQTIEKYVR